MDPVAAERASLELDLREINREIQSAHGRLDHAARKGKNEEYQAESARVQSLFQRRSYIEANLKRLNERRPGGLPSSQTGIWIPLVLHEHEPITPSFQEVLTPAQAIPAVRRSAPATESLSHLIGGIVRSTSSHKRSVRELRDLVPLAGEHAPTLRLIAAAFDGFNRSDLATELRLRIGTMTGAPENLHGPPLSPVVILPLDPMPPPEDLPDARDGLTRHQRIVLSAMHALWFRADGAPKKTSLLVAELQLRTTGMTAAQIDQTLGQLNQPWSRRNPLVEIIGATCRLKQLAEELFVDLEKDTVDFEEGFSFKVPRVLPAPVPMLLANGTAGIPPHALGELLQAAVYRLQFPDCSAGDLIALVHGPDLPTGGVLPHSPSGLYSLGRGQVEVRARLELQSLGVRARYVVTEFPWSCWPADVASGLRSIEGVTEVRDVSTPETDSVVVELEHVAHAHNVREALTGSSALKRVIEVELRINDDGSAVVVTLGQILDRFLEHRRNVVTRRLCFELERLEERAEEIEGLLVASELLESVMGALDDADDAAQQLVRLEYLATQGGAGERLVQAARTLVARLREEESRHPGTLSHDYRLGFSSTQARTILKKRRLRALPRESLFREWVGLAGDMAQLRAPLENKESLDQLIHDELIELKTRLATPRRTMVDRSVR